MRDADQKAWVHVRMTDTREQEPERKAPNGTITRILQFGQMLTIGCVIPWGVWVTGQIYGLRAFESEIAQWKAAREKAQIATTTEVELARLKVKDEILSVMSTKMDSILNKLNDVDLKLTRHEASTSKIP